ncbi:ATP synthase F subunit [Allochromatium warmingii]|uniref:ATP synthase F subunit n=1 Tax=Allochromatium warmingii TaxID=61595 RepID=A0A1H3F9Q5_ALLWA|nr:V-type ATP synthase subunit F [Allochromatium warmingii]SDX87088.1 ATP synthase F subunit [Allochromatium warmingii]
MDTPSEPGQPTRLLFLGEENLADGFRLIGFEAHPNPSPAQVEQILRQLQHTHDKAFVLVDEALMREDIPQLKRVRREGGRILVMAVPSLQGPTALSSDVAERLAALFGTATLRSE